MQIEGPAMRTWLFMLPILLRNDRLGAVGRTRRWRA